jgi:hypothetical protein
VVAKPPYTPVFARALAALLREPVVSKALRSSTLDLDASHRRALVAFIQAVAGREEEKEEDGVGVGEVGEEEQGEGEGAAVTPSKGEENEDGMEVDGEPEKQQEKKEEGPSPLLDPAMRKGLRLVYAEFLE